MFANLRIIDVCLICFVCVHFCGILISHPLILLHFPLLPFFLPFFKSTLSFLYAPSCATHHLNPICSSFLVVPLQYSKFYFLNYCAVFVQAAKRTQFTQVQNAPFSHVVPDPTSGGKKILAGKTGRRKQMRAMPAPPPRATPAPPPTMQSCLCVFSYYKIGKGESTCQKR